MNVDINVTLTGLNSREDDMSRPRPGTVILPEANDIFLYDPDVIFQPKEYVGYVLKNTEEMVYASECVIDVLVGEHFTRLSPPLSHL